MNSTLMKQELNSSSLKEGLQFLCDKDFELKALLKKRKGQITKGVKNDISKKQNIALRKNTGAS